VWDNLGRVAAEFAHIDRIRTYDPAIPGSSPADADIEYSPQTLERFQRLRDDGKPALIFTAHLGNWELPAQIEARYGLDTVILYRRPNLGQVADAVIATRSGSMGTLMDQYYVRGVDVIFFGRRTKANPLLARLARQVECPIHGVRVVRLPGDRFRCDLTEAVTPARDAAGRVDVVGTMQAVTGVIEGWVREHPEQWLWLHRRWREE
jgi:KDO2-lipid IV(A) lauroyltransferase